MPEKKKKELTRSEKYRAAAKKLEAAKLPKGPVLKNTPVKARPKKKVEESWVAKLKKKVQKFLNPGIAKKSVPDTVRTKEIQRELAKAGAKVKTDRERAAEKRKREQNK